MKVKPWSGYRLLPKVSQGRNDELEAEIAGGRIPTVTVYEGFVLDGLAAATLCRKHGVEFYMDDKTDFINERWPEVHPFFYYVHYPRLSAVDHVVLCSSMINQYYEATPLTKMDCIETFFEVGQETRSFFDHCWKIGKCEDAIQALRDIELKVGLDFLPEASKVVHGYMNDQYDEEVSIKELLMAHVTHFVTGKGRLDNRRKLKSVIKAAETSAGKAARELTKAQTLDTMNEKEKKLWQDLNSRLEEYFHVSMMLRESLDTSL